MLEIALNFEQFSTRFDPLVLAGTGLICVVVGLFLWLGGLGHRKILAAVAGAVSGGVCGLFVVGGNTVLIAGLAAIACIVAVVFERFFLAVLAACLAAIFVFAFLARPYVGEELGYSKQDTVYDTQSMDEPLSVRQTVEIVKDSAADFFEQLKYIYSQMPAYNWAIIAVLVVIVMAAGIFLWSLTSALCCAVLGTQLIFCGMILLLLYKGAKPISSVSQKQSFYFSVFLAMVAFGTGVQLLLCRRERIKHKAKRQTDKDEQEHKEKFRDWRRS